MVGRHRFGQTRPSYHLRRTFTRCCDTHAHEECAGVVVVGCSTGRGSFKTMPGSLLVYGGDVSRRLTLSNTPACIDCAPSEGCPLMVFNALEFFCSCCGKPKGVKVVVCSDCKRNQ